MASLKIEITESELRELVRKRLVDVLGAIDLDEKLIKIQVRSKQNYKSEWEEAQFRATYEYSGALLP